MDHPAPCKRHPAGAFFAWASSDSLILYFFSNFFLEILHTLWYASSTSAHDTKSTGCSIRYCVYEYWVRYLLPCVRILGAQS